MNRIRGKFLISFTALVLMAFCLQAAETSFNTGAEFRWRGTLDDKGFYQDSSDVGTYGDLRTRLYLKYQKGNAEAYVQFQYANTIGWDASTLDQDSSFDVHQAYLKYNHFLWNNLSLKLGRTELIYGDQRLIGAVGWSNTGRTFDGAVINYNTEMFNADLFLTKQNERFYSGSRDILDDDFRGLWAKFKPLKLNFFFLRQCKAAADTSNEYQNTLTRNTYGIHYQNKYDMGLGTIFNFAMQSGSKTDLATDTTMEAETDLSAMMYMLEVFYMMDMNMNPVLGIGIDYTSGDDPGTDDKIETFDNLYYTGHKFRGVMDYFIKSENMGLQDIYVNAKILPVERLNLAMSFHMFTAAQEYADGKDAIGNELDLSLKYKLTKEAGLLAGLGYFMPSDDWKKDSDNSMYGYLQLTTNFDFEF